MKSNVLAGGAGAVDTIGAPADAAEGARVTGADGADTDARGSFAARGAAGAVGGVGGARFATAGGVADADVLAGAAAAGPGAGAGAGVEATGGAGAGAGATATGDGSGAGAAGEATVWATGVAVSGCAVDALFKLEHAVAAKHSAAIAHCNDEPRRAIRSLRSTTVANEVQ